MGSGLEGASEQDDGRSASRDAWAVDGFAPLPGDHIRLPSSVVDPEQASADAVVQTVYLCSESDGAQTVLWSWIVLEGWRLLEIAPRGCALYEPPAILPRGSSRFLEFAAQDGALVRFEERVRAGEWQARPVRLTLQQRRWRLTATGTVTAQRLGPAPETGWAQLRPGGVAPLPAARLPPSGTTPWQIRGREAVDGPQEADETPLRDADQHVYFTLASESDPQLLGLGVWMTDIALAFGRRLGDSPAMANLRVLAG